MKNDKRLDEAFRAGLPSVEVPPPPAQDWAAMARSAKQGARAAAVRDRGSVLNTHWLKLLGGASAILAAWYMATGSQPTEQPPAQATVTTGATTAQAEFLGAAPAALIELINEEVRQGPTTTSKTSQAEGPGERVPAKAETRGNDLPHAPMDATAEGTAGSVAAMGMNMRTGSSDEGTERTSDDVRSISGKADEPGTISGSPARTESITSTRAHATTDGVAISTSASDAAPRSDIGFMDLLPPRASALPYTPNGPTKEAYTVPSFAHWSLAPWFALGRSTWTDPEGKAAADEQLDAGTEGSDAMGLRLQYAVDRRFALITGIQMARKGVLRGTVRSSPTVSTDYRLSGEYIEVPLLLKCTLPVGNTDLYMRAGAVLQFNRHSGSDRVTMNDGTMKEMSTLALGRGSMGTALDVGIGAQFRIGRSIGLFIEPSYQHSLSPVVKHPSFDKLPFNPRIHTFSLAAGLSFQLP